MRTTTRGRQQEKRKPLEETGMVRDTGREQRGPVLWNQHKSPMEENH